jgi:hypothetical protein
MNHIAVLVVLGIVLVTGLMVIVIPTNAQAPSNTPITPVFCSKFSEKDVRITTWCFDTYELCKQAEEKVTADGNVIINSCHERR